MLAARVKVMFLIRSLDCGGAERQLVELVKNLDKSAFEVTVVTLYSGGRLTGELTGLPHARICSLEKKSRWDLGRMCQRLGEIVRAVRPHVVHGYMDVGNTLALMLSRIIKCKVVLGVRASNVDHSAYGLVSRCLDWTLSRSADKADLIIANSHAAKSYMSSRGYPAERITVIHNGIDSNRFKPNAAAGARFRSTNGIKSDDVVIGCVARLDPMKDHPTLLNAFAIAAARHPALHLVCAGTGAPAYAEHLRMLAERLEIQGRVHWLGSVPNVDELYSMFDIATLSSAFGEGFPNAVAEAMACGVPCVGTDVGDAKILVRDCGCAVPPQNENALVDAWTRALRELTPDLKARNRDRIVEHFSLRALGERTGAALMDVARLEVAGSI